MANYKNLNSFGVVPKETKEQVMSRADRDDHLYQIGKDCAEQGLPRDLVVEYDNDRDIECFNMGYSVGEYDNG